jgi:hypothetical protein
MFLIDIHKLPRPERSGTIAVIVAYLLLTGIADINAAPFMGGGESLWGLFCYLAPCSLLWPPQKPEEAAQWHGHFVHLYFGKGNGKPSGECVCHLEERVDGVTTHIYFPDLPSCDSDWVSPREWIFPFGDNFQWRYLCEPLNTRHPGEMTKRY